ncbi:MAG TPA: hypothetical protein VKF59_16345 [Candidatus Dormibacteraeota bacterium]|nr:hypothetical protein [Candidatus Dormibacteraeota bacterium]
MVNSEGLQALRASLEADGYRLDVREEGDRLGAWVSAGPDACAECLVPRPVFLAMLEHALGVPGRSIDLRYPGEPGPAPAGQ